MVTAGAREREGGRRLEGKQKTFELGKMEDGTNQRKGLDNSRHPNRKKMLISLFHSNLSFCKVQLYFFSESLFILIFSEALFQRTSSEL